MSYNYDLPSIDYFLDYSSERSDVITNENIFVLCGQNLCYNHADVTDSQSGFYVNNGGQLLRCEEIMYNEEPIDGRNWQHVLTNPILVGSSNTDITVTFMKKAENGNYYVVSYPKDGTTLTAIDDE